VTDYFEEGVRRRTDVLPFLFGIPCISLWLVVGGFASVVGNTVILTVVRLFERLRIAEGRDSQEHTPLVSLI
jgi:hypothetical protein